jgi:ABC-2 type transport system permease protein
MTAMTFQPRKAVAEEHRLSFGHLLRSEWIKFFSLRANILGLAAIVAAGVGVSMIFALTMEDAGLPTEFSVKFVLDGLTLGTLLFGQIIAGTLGVLAMTSEYSSGTIQSTVTAVPTRVHMLASKALVLFLIVTTTGLLSLFGSWVITWGLYADFGLQAELTTPGFALALLGGAVYIGLCSVFGLGLGTLLRSSAAGVIAVISLTLLAPVFLSVLSGEIVRTIRLFLMGHAGDSMARITDPGLPFADASEQYLSPVGGWITAVMWAVVTLVAAAIALRRRDV